MRAIDREIHRAEVGHTGQGGVDGRSIEQHQDLVAAGAAQLHGRGCAGTALPHDRRARDPVERGGKVGHAGGQARRLDHGGPANPLTGRDPHIQPRDPHGRRIDHDARTHNPPVHGFDLDRRLAEAERGDHERVPARGEAAQHGDAARVGDPGETHAWSDDGSTPHGSGGCGSGSSADASVPRGPARDDRGRAYRHLHRGSHLRVQQAHRGGQHDGGGGHRGHHELGLHSTPSSPDGEKHGRTSTLLRGRGTTPSLEGVDPVTEERSPGSGRVRSPSRASLPSGSVERTLAEPGFRVPYSGGAAPDFHRTSERPSVCELSTMGRKCAAGAQPWRAAGAQNASPISRGSAGMTTDSCILKWDRRPVGLIRPVARPHRSRYPAPLTRGGHRKSV